MLCTIRSFFLCRAAEDELFGPTVVHNISAGRFLQLPELNIERIFRRPSRELGDF